MANKSSPPPWTGHKQIAVGTLATSEQAMAQGVVPDCVTIVGAGTMGRGIAQVFSLRGCKKVVVIDVEYARAREAVAGVLVEIKHLAERGKITPPQALAAHQCLEAAKDFGEAHRADLIIEAIVEQLEVKKQLLRDIENRVGSNAILATNTSALSVTALAGVCHHSERVIGLHFFNPVGRMALVEVVRTHQTDPAVADRAASYVRGLGKTPILVQDTPGFVVNRVARPFYLESLKILAEGVYTPGQIDAAIRAAGFRMGAFELLDLIGLDVNFAVSCAVFEGYFFEPRFRPNILQGRMVSARLLGRKTGRGFYDYPDERSPAPHEPVPDYDPADPLSLPGLHPIASRIVAMVVNEAAFALGEGIAAREAIDDAMRLGMNFPRGPLDWGESLGLGRVVRLLDTLRTDYGEERYRVAPWLRRHAPRCAAR